MLTEEGIMQKTLLCGWQPFSMAYDSAYSTLVNVPTMHKARVRQNWGNVQKWFRNFGAAMLALKTYRVVSPGCFTSSTGVTKRAEFLTAGLGRDQRTSASNTARVGEEIASSDATTTSQRLLLWTKNEHFFFQMADYTQRKWTLHLSLYSHVGGQRQVYPLSISRQTCDRSQPLDVSKGRSLKAWMNWACTEA